MLSFDPRSSARRRLIRRLVPVVAFFGTIWAVRYFSPTAKYQPKYHTIAQRYLDLEAKYDPVSDDAYELLDEVIDEVVQNAHYDSRVTDPAENENSCSASSTPLMRS